MSKTWCFISTSRDLSPAYFHSGHFSLLSNVCVKSRAYMEAVIYRRSFARYFTLIAKILSVKLTELTAWIGSK